ncbi:DUF2934 domain-containing protein [Methylomagnum sp.]
MARKALAAMDDPLNETQEDFLSNISAEFPDQDDSENFQKKVAELAYLKAEKRGFEPGFELEDWLEAEQEVRAGLFAIDD